MKLAIAVLLAAILGWQFTTAVTSAARDVTKAEKATCRGKVML